MSNVVALNQDECMRSLTELENINKFVKELMKTPHYQKMGEVGIFTIVQKARTVGLNPLDALNGAMYFVNGKVELAANTMNFMIRAKGHSIVKDERSTPECCILKGKRVDNGDTWVASFSIKEAKAAGIYKNTWEKYPDDMLFARALTRLARQLFPDVIKGCYVEGEISDAISAGNIPQETSIEIETEELISSEKARELSDLLNKCAPKFQELIEKRLSNIKVSPSLENLPVRFEEQFRKAMEENIATCKAIQEKAVGE